MLELDALSLSRGSGDNAQVILHEVSAKLPQGKLVAVVGPDTRGNLEFLDVIGGLRKASQGSVKWNGGNGPCHVGLFGTHTPIPDRLTPREIVADALRLRVSSHKGAQRTEQVGQILLETGLATVSNKQARFLSAEQRFRLRLAVELVASPQVLLCEPLPCELDPKAEMSVLRLLCQVCEDRNCLILWVTGNLRHLPLFDSLLVFYAGHLAYHGPNQFLFHYFNISNPEDLFPRLAQRKPMDWHNSWRKHRDAYYASQTDAYQAVRSSEEEPDEADAPKKQASSLPEAAHRLSPVADSRISFLIQLAVLSCRRWKLFFRNRARFLTHLSLILAVPCVAILSVWKGLPLVLQKGSAPQLGGIISQLAMFEAILLSLAGALNGASEIAGERGLLEKEKSAGLSMAGYLGSKLMVVVPLAAAQSIWTAFFVSRVCHVPGNLWEQAGFLFGVAMAITAISLGISAWSSSADRARLIAVSLVALQLPLSGTVLSIPEIASRILRFADTAYWGWSGFVQTVGNHSGIERLGPMVLGAQILLGLIAAFIGAKRTQKL